MMKKACILLFVLSNLFSTLYSQSGINSMMPVDIRKAYREGTRSISGLPGVNYWQNYAKYQISAEILAEESQLTGEETIVYYNNSPDTLRKIVIRLYQDMYKKGNPRDFSIDSSDLHEGTTISHLIINGREIELTDPLFVTRTPTNLIINLFNEIMPADSIIINCSWSFHIPEKRQVRMGNYGNSNFFIAYWYPQIAVYDDIDGWDLNEYTGTVEFYNDFNDYDVEIKTPANFLIWATGELQNGNDIYREEINARIEKVKSSDEIVIICSTKETLRKKVLQKNNGNIWHYAARGVTDFSFAATIDANWEASSLMVDDKSGRRVLISAVYPDSVNSFNQVAKYANQSIRYMSEELPDWPFPYPQMTVFCNEKRSGGMETPMMANNGDSNNLADEDRLTFHEISHTYYPFYMGTNERKYAWMDEGWAAYLVSGYSDIFSPGNTYFDQIVNSFEKFNGKEAEIPPMYLSYQISNYQSYRVHAYVRSSLALAFLRESLGDSLFLNGLQYYMKAWNGKHPLPFDFFNCFSLGSGQQLDWYFIPWYFEHSTADLGIKKITSDNQLIISNYGGLPLPVVITCEFSDGSQEVINRSPVVWSSGDSAISIQLDTTKKIKKLTIGSDQIPDVNKSNNVMVF